MPQYNDDDEEVTEHAIQDICESFITSLCIEVACDMHRAAKTGEIPYSEILIPFNSNQLPTKQIINDGDEIINGDTNNGSGKNNDIWGRVPPKEPKSNSHCPVCNRSVNVSSFARHLDKCMGIGTARGIGNSVTRSSSSK